MSREFILTAEFERQLKALSDSEDLLKDIEQEIFKDLESPIN
jgi:hypothetical protein